MSRLLRFCAMLLIACLADSKGVFGQDADQTPLLELVRNSKTVLFLGDSITASGQYVAGFECWLLTQKWSTYPTIINAGLPSETVSGLSEDGHAGGQFPRPDLAERLDRVLSLIKPNLVISCYGMNCAVYQPYSQERFEHYQAGYRQLKQKVEASGAKLIVVTPPFYDDMKKPFSGFSYNEVLDKYSQWLVDQKDNGWKVIDLHSAMTREIGSKRKDDPKYSLQPDAVHPSPEGHWCIAKHFVLGLGGKITDDTSAEKMLQVAGYPPEIMVMIQKRGEVLRNSYVATAGHKRPGVAAGLPIDAARLKADELTAEIQKLLPKP